MSNIKFSGKIYKEPELRYLPTGEPVLQWRMSLYTGKTKAGEYKKSQWVTVNSWGEDAERLNKELHEKMTITVEGVPQEPRTYKDKVTGIEKQAGLEVTAYRVALSDEFRELKEDF